MFSTLPLAFREIRRNLLRSTLTVLGIVIGVWAVITMVTLGAGATLRVKNDISVLGFNLVLVIPAVERRGGGGLIPGAEPFDMADARAIGEQLPDVAAVAPWTSQPLLAVYGNRNWSTITQGSDNAFFVTRGWEFAQGRRFTEAELRSGKAVCVIGATVREELFGGRNPVGIKIRLGKLSYEIIGVLQGKGRSFSGEDQDDLVVLPIRAFQRRVSGNRDVALIFVSAREERLVPEVRAQVERLMRQRRRVPPGAPDDFSVRGLQEIAAVIETTTSVLTAFVSAIAAVSLLVGGIGIMNTMLVTVTERTREIGIRLAIGAFERQVLLQFLAEAGLLSALGGLLGIVLGLATAAAAAAALAVPFALNPLVILLAFGFSSAVGLVFGYYPARRAARLNPIDALRHE